ncbi:MAG: LemA family protein [Carnobacterium sp.]|uniref:LemA family protein n=1 Tax=Carnobacterium antarcticum TaxID=2126436 RepID=A0ABW4NQT6_9LACT|nr:MULTISPECIES: LemA family protein [unclassified Carnobacterium]ALV21192.1 LemA family protein [Carnobacterium sp. CP1]QQP71324.1 LemA family protein [Carnobacterium sp. CS13]
MKKSVKIIIGVVIALLILVVPFVSSYNGLIQEESNVDVAWSQVESQLQRRNDLIPNLVNSVKGAMNQEQAVFGDIADARAQLGGADTVEEKIDANNEMSSALSRLLVVVENYPELKSNENVTALMDELAGTENRVAVERQRYNEAVQGYNNRVRRFPGSIIASMTGFEKKPYFKAVEGAETAPEVNFD